MPRIRSLKPENWQDERVGHVSRDARLLRDVLITFADDDGRWRHLPSAIIGHGYPYDEDVSPAKIQRWTAELVGAGAIIRYEVDGGEYGCFPRWHLHQYIQKYAASLLPACDDPRVVSREEARKANGKVTAARRYQSDTSPVAVRDSSHPRAHARVPDPIHSLPDPPSSAIDEEPTAPVARASRAPLRAADQDQLPPDVPERLHGLAEQIAARLNAVWTERGGNEPTIRGVGLALKRFPDRDHLAIVAELEHWALAGRGQAKPVKDWTRTFATFLESSPVGAPSKRGAAGAAWDQATARHAEIDEWADRLAAARQSQPTRVA